MTYLEEYWELIEKGEVVAGYWVKREIGSLIRDIQNPRYIYDTTESDRRIRFEQSLCLQSKVPYYMQPLDLLPWQKAWWEAFYSFRFADGEYAGQRRFIEGLLLVARKNGKSTMLAADGNFDLFCGQGGASICCASNDDRQARLIWGEMAGMRSRLDPKKRVTGQTLTELCNRIRDVVVFRLSQKTQNKDGFNLTKALLDESHDIREQASEIAEALWRGMSTLDDPIFINVTTNGFNRGKYLDQKIDHCKRVILGEVDDERLLPLLYMQDTEQEIWQDEASWEKSNPSIRYGVKKIGKLRRDVELARENKAVRAHLLTKDFNWPLEGSEVWLNSEDYDYPTDGFRPEDFRGCYCLGFVDLSATTDLSSAKAMVVGADGRKYVHSHYWTVEGKMADIGYREAGADYLEWAKAGWLTIHEGNEIDITDIADWYYRLYKEHGIKPLAVGYDQRFSKPFTDRMAEYGITVEMILQGKVLSNAMKLTEAELKAKVVDYNGCPPDRWCLGNCSYAVDGYGNIMPVKTQDNKRIDGAVTLIGVYEMYRRHKAEMAGG